MENCGVDKYGNQAIILLNLNHETCLTQNTKNEVRSLPDILGTFF